jgi:hypothetical protein
LITTIKGGIKSIDGEILQEKCVDNFLNPTEDLAATKDQEMLEHLLDFFDKEFNYEINEVCETLRSEIGSSFTLDQLIGAFYKKFDQFAEK